MKYFYLQTLFYCLLIFGLLISCANNDRGDDLNISIAEPGLIPVTEGFSATSVNAVIFRKNSIFTHDHFQYIAFYDPDGRVVLGKRIHGTEDWELETTPFTGEVMNAHNSISIAVDGDGFLHLAWNHHNRPLNYARSTDPGSLSMTEPFRPGSLDTGHRVTYPEFYRMPDGSLLFMYRHGSSGDGYQVLHHYDMGSQTWILLHEQLIDGLGEVNPYWQTTIDGQGTLHISWTWRRHRGVESNHDIAYARSKDGGKTWEKTTGEVYALPITPETAEYALRIPENSSLMNQTSMAADSEGRPYIVNYWRPAGSTVPQYHLVFHDGDSWKVSQVGNLTKEFELAGGGTMAPPISRPQIAVDTSGDRDRAFLIFRAEERGGKVSVAINHDLQKDVWHFHDLTDFSVLAWEPTFDTQLWQNEKKLHLYVQKVGQLDHERPDDVAPQMVYVLEWEP
jgi:hypothetical protein